jgi:hypothetical protein
MRLLSLLTPLLALASPVVSTALTYKLGPNERQCFYTFVERSGAKVAFYFAVQSGGAFDVDYLVRDQDTRIILEGMKERQGDFVFTANREGEYEFCFSNDMSTFAEKMVDFEITVSSPVGVGWEDWSLGRL